MYTLTAEGCNPRGFLYIHHEYVGVGLQQADE